MAIPTKKKDQKKKDEPAGTNAKEVAEAMAVNMAANQADPNWEDEHERMWAEAAHKVLAKKEQEKPRKDDKKKDEPGGPSAKEVAEAMAANMAANQADPDFELKREARNQEAAEYALQKHKKQLADAGIHISGDTEESEKKT